jgi:hypothetical protein
MMHVDIEAGPFRASYEDGLEISDLPSFERDLRILYRDLKGSARFESIDPPLALEVVGNGLGRMRLIGKVRDSVHPDANTLTFHFGFDQTSIPVALRGLEEVNARLVQGGWRGPR